MAVRIQEADFDIAVEVAALTRGRTDIGAVVTFTGLVRGGEREADAIQSMTLEHYPGMTEAELERVEAEAEARFQLSACLVIHRVGRLVPGDRIVLVAAASRHRRAAFEAAEFMMDYLKTRAPFWKKEIAASGEGHWVDARACDDAAVRRWREP